MIDNGWFGEPFVTSTEDGRTAIGEMRLCNGQVISGGALVHSKPCPMHDGKSWQSTIPPESESTKGDSDA